MSSHHNASPVNPLPPAVLALFGVMAVAELVFSLGARGLAGGPEAIGWRVAAIERFAFSGDILSWMLQTRSFPLEHVMRLVTYAFVNGSFTTTLFACVMLLALGKMVAEALGPGRMLGIFFGSAVGGALIYAASGAGAPLYGGFPPVYGLIGAFTYLAWVRAKRLGEAQLKAFSLIGVLLGLQLVFGLLFGGGPWWIAEVGGFLCGFGLTTMMVPGGTRKLIDRIRR